MGRGKKRFPTLRENTRRVGKVNYRGDYELVVVIAVVIVVAIVIMPIPVV
jgi:hypothetical protein